LKPVADGIRFAHSARRRAVDSRRLLCIRWAGTACSCAVLGHVARTVGSAAEERGGSHIAATGDAALSKASAFLCRRAVRIDGARWAIGVRIDDGTVGRRHGRRLAGTHACIKRPVAGHRNGVAVNAIQIDHAHVALNDDFNSNDAKASAGCDGRRGRHGDEDVATKNDRLIDGDTNEDDIAVDRSDSEAVVVQFHDVSDETRPRDRPREVVKDDFPMRVLATSNIQRNRGTAAAGRRPNVMVDTNNDAVEGTS